MKPVETAASLEEPTISLDDDLLPVVSTDQAWALVSLPSEGTRSMALDPAAPLDGWINAPAALDRRGDAAQTHDPAQGPVLTKSIELPDLWKSADLVLNAASFGDAPITLGDEPGPTATEPLAWRQGNSVPVRVDPPAASRIEPEQEVRGPRR